VISVVKSLTLFLSEEDPPMFEGFTLTTVKAGEIDIRLRHGGSGPPLLLLHGHPRPMSCGTRSRPGWRDFTVIAPDLRGYGGSAKPATTADHEPYSKRAMARDQIALMRHFGFERFAVAGHDRGGRVAYRLALDHPDAVEKLAVLDIVPTGEMYRRADMAFGLGYWHWFFLAQPAPLPERMIGADPEAYYFHGVRERFARGLGGLPELRPRSPGDPRHVRGLSRRGDLRLQARRGRARQAPHRRPAAGALGRQGHDAEMV
jgi:pimeloyl-ACP methyl ester carboxylesterase